VYPYDGHVLDPAAVHTHCGRRSRLSRTGRKYLHASVLIAVDAHVDTRSLLCVADYAVDVRRARPHDIGTYLASAAGAFGAY
jgi:hypothetical protein